MIRPNPGGRPIVALALALALALPAPASAKVLHRYSSSFNGADAPGGPFSLPLADAVDGSGGASDGDVYVASHSSSQNSIYRFDAAGAYAGLQVAGIPQFTNAHSPGYAGIAVDDSGGANNGDLYAGDIENGVVDRLSEAGAVLCEITGRPTPSANECNGAAGSATPAGSLSPRGVAVDSVGDVFVADGEHRVIDEFAPSGAYMGTIEAPQIEFPGPIALDALGHLYVANASLVGGGTLVKCSLSPTLSCGVLDNKDTTAVAVDAADNVYVAEIQPNRIAEYDPAGNLVDTFAEAGEIAHVVGLAAGSTGTLYAADSSKRAVEIFGALVVPDATTGQATEVAETTATLNGHVAPDLADGGGEVTSCNFEYVGQSSFEAEGYAGATSVPCSPPTPYAGGQDVSAALAGLSAGRTYHFRLDASNSNGVASYGADRTFSTFGPPTIDSQSSSQARAHTAVLEAEIDPHGNDTTCQAQYVDQASFDVSGFAAATTVPCTPSDLGSGFGAQAASASLGGLAIDTTYHYRFLATSSAAAGGVEGADQTFATFGIESFAMQPLDREGNPYTQAGGHPYELTTEINLARTTIPVEGRAVPGPDENVKDIHTELPPGLIGNPTATATCRRSMVPIFECPGAAQVGLLVAHVAGGSEGTEKFEEPIYNLVPPPGVAAEWGARISNAVTASIDFHLRSGGDYGIDSDSVDISADSGVFGVSLTVWGVPAAAAHDADRFCPGGEFGNPKRGCSAETALKPLLTEPTSCTGPQTARVSVDSWQHIGEWVGASTTLPAITGCQSLDFGPTLKARPTTDLADSPSGLSVDLHLPAREGCTAAAGGEALCESAEAELKDAKVTLPEGLVVNPSGANGLDACSAAQIGYQAGTSGPAEFTPDPAACPDASRIGTVAVHTQLLDHPLPGSVYLAKPYDNPFGSLLAIYVAVYDPVSGVVVKLPGRVEADPQTGRLTTSFEANPQLPFEDFELEFFKGATAPLMTPPTCGSYATTSALASWAGQSAAPADKYAIDRSSGGGSCASSAAAMPNSPSFQAGAVTPIAGAFSPFVLNLRREDGSQRLSVIETTLPKGLLGKLAGVPYCPQSAIDAAGAKSGREEQASPSCPSASQVGSVVVGAGAGPAPYYVRGETYLAGPYKGAPLSLAVITPAVAGPFDLGTVVTRVALQVDPATSQITAKSDPLPSVLKAGGDGFPLDIRSIALKIDRPGFTLNPTSCDPMAVGGSVLSTAGQSAALTSRFQVAECGRLGFEPRLSLRVRGATHRSGFPALTATLTMPEPGVRYLKRCRRHGKLRHHCRVVVPRQANIAAAQVTLPHAAFVANAHLDKTCLRPQLESHSCPARSIYGTAKAWSPLLDRPLEGNVYLVTGFGYELPALVADLDGQIEVHLIGKIDTGRSHALRNTFEVVPDAPVSKFVLAMDGGKRGLIELSEPLCSPHTDRKALARFTAHNGKVDEFEPVVGAPCKSGRHRHHHRAGKGPHRTAGRAGK